MLQQRIPGSIAIPKKIKSGDVEVRIDGSGNILIENGGTELARVNTNGTLLIGDTANANMTVGVTISQGPNDDQAFALKSSDVATGLTTGGYGFDVETDDYLAIGKLSATLGGTLVKSVAEDAAALQVLSFGVYGGTANTNKTTAAIGLTDFYVAEHDGANALANITADGSVFTIRARVGGSDVARFLIDEDGDMYSVTAGQTFDAHDDAALVRSLDLVRGDTIHSEFDRFIRTDDNERHLIALGVLGGPVDEGGMTNVTQLQRLHNGAIWQQAATLRAFMSVICKWVPFLRRPVQRALDEAGVGHIKALV